MAFRLLAQPLRGASTPMGTRTYAHMSYLDPKKTKITIGVDGVPTEHHIYGHKIGTREIVGYGWNGLPTYCDRNDFPFPAIRWREDGPEFTQLRQKEKGDWKQLSKLDKKKLYRFTFCQTFAEMDAPTGEWKLCVAGALIAGALSIWIAIWMRLYILPAYPKSLSEEARKAQLKRMLDIGVGHVDGISSKWDYENKRWK